MKKKPATVQDYFELGQFYILNRKYTEAIKQLKAALKLKADPQIYFQLGVAYEASSQNALAIEMYRKVIELDPNHKEAIEHLNHLTS